jgi:hypothetical protein
LTIFYIPGQVFARKIIFMEELIISEGNRDHSPDGERVV